MFHFNYPIDLIILGVYEPLLPLHLRPFFLDFCRGLIPLRDIRTGQTVILMGVFGVLRKRSFLRSVREVSQRGVRG